MTKQKQYNEKLYQIRKVISANEVEQATSEGWKIIESFEVEDAVACPEDRMQEFPIHIHLENQQDMYGLQNALEKGIGGVHHLMKYEKVKQVVFLVGKTEDTVVWELNGQIKQLEEGAAAQVEIVTGMEKEKGEVAKRCTKLEESMGSLRDDRDLYRKQKRETDDRVREMEADISKIRNAIGERQMNEILKGTS
jgi:hypothetical protein